jgi:hypothetical protein
VAKLLAAVVAAVWTAPWYALGWLACSAYAALVNGGRVGLGRNDAEPD